MRDPWLLLLFVANPFFIDALAGGQYSFLWATAAFFALVWSVERERWVLAAVLMWLTASTHPIEGGMAVGAYVLFLLVYRPQTRRPVLAASAAALAGLVPFIYLALQTPALAENSASHHPDLDLPKTCPRRGLVMVAPFALSAFGPALHRHYRTAGLGLLGAGAAAVVFSSGLASQTALASIPVVRSVAGEGSYYGMRHASANDYRGYMQSGDLRPNMVYRVLSPNEREQGAYVLLQHHAVLANEFFSESQKRHSWDESTYQCYLAAKHVDRVSLERGYESEFKTNEQTLLDALTRQGLVRVTYRGRDVTVLRRLGSARQPPGAGFDQRLRGDVMFAKLRDSTQIVRRGMPLLTIAFLADAAFIFLFLIVLQAYLPESLHASAAIAGYALAAFGIAKLLTQVASGVVSDRLGTRPAMILGTALLVTAGAAMWPLAHVAP